MTDLCACLDPAPELRFFRIFGYYSKYERHVAFYFYHWCCLAMGAEVRLPCGAEKAG